MRELAALGIVNTSAVAGYNNSELQITLTNEYSWFKGKEFKGLLNRHKIFGPEQSTFDSCENQAPQSHAETKSTLETQVKNSDKCDDYNAKKVSDNDRIFTNGDSTNINSIQLSLSEPDSDRQLGIVSSDKDRACDGEFKSEEKNNAPLWGSKRFQHVTVTRSLADSSDDFRYTLTEILEVIRRRNGSEIAFNFVVESVYFQNERIKLYVGEKLTSRENKKVRNLALEIIRNKNIEVVKHKPQLLVRWNSS